MCPIPHHGFRFATQDLPSHTPLPLRPPPPRWTGGYGYSEPGKLPCGGLGSGYTPYLGFTPLQDGPSGGTAGRTVSPPPHCGSPTSGTRTFFHPTTHTARTGPAPHLPHLPLTSPPTYRFAYRTDAANDGLPGLRLHRYPRVFTHARTHLPPHAHCARYCGWVTAGCFPATHLTRVHAPPHTLLPHRYHHTTFTPPHAHLLHTHTHTPCPHGPVERSRLVDTPHG